MSKKEYKFNPQTLTYEVIATPFRLRSYRILRKILIGFILASLVNFLFSYFFYTPKMYYIERDNREMLMKYDILQEKIGAATHKISEIKHRDQHVYRSLFAADTLAIPGIYNDYSEEKYEEFQYDRYTPLMAATWNDLDAMARLIYLESVSLDELQMLSFDKERMAQSIPAIWPIDRRYLRGSIGLFGGRNHPVLRVFRQHKGIDLGAKTGTPVYATANGRVVRDGDSGRGYGLQVLIDHDFGYKTRYAHLSKILVTPGQVVKRGELIGEVGSTGLSSGPHLHYEVIYMNRPVDPINYFRRDMDEREFAKIIESAKETDYEP